MRRSQMEIFWQRGIYRRAAESILNRLATPFLYMPIERKWFKVKSNEGEAARRILEPTLKVTNP